MKLWLVTNTTVNGYDTYDSAVIAAETEEQALLTYPGYWWEKEPWDGSKRGEWGDALDNTAKYIGETDEDAGVILASFNAG